MQISALTVALTEPMSENEVALIADAIRLLRGVRSVEPHKVDPDHLYVAAKVRWEVLQKLQSALGTEAEIVRSIATLRKPSDPIAYAKGGEPKCECVDVHQA